MSSLFSFFTLRRTALFIFLMVCGLMATGFYMEHVMGLEPCLLCMTQRVCMSIVAGIALIAFIHNPKAWGWRIYATLCALWAIAGGAFASRQIWLQHLPKDQVPACGPSLEFMLEAFPLKETLMMMLQGDGNCAEVAWTFLSLSIPQWTLLAFILMLLLSIRLLLRK